MRLKNGSVAAGRPTKPAPAPGAQPGARRPASACATTILGFGGLIGGPAHFSAPVQKRSSCLCRDKIYTFDPKRRAWGQNDWAGPEAASDERSGRCSDINIDIDIDIDTYIDIDIDWANTSGGTEARLKHIKSAIKLQRRLQANATASSARVLLCTKIRQSGAGTARRRARRQGR